MNIDKRYHVFLQKNRHDVFLANERLFSEGLVILTWGNVSQKSIFEGKPFVFIKPSGVPYEQMKENDIVVVNMSGEVIEGKLSPSTDLMTHLVLYRNFADVFGIAHAHSQYGTAWAQSGLDIPNFGTTHSDFYIKSIPCTRKMTDEEIHSNYEENTGKVIVETLSLMKPRPNGVLVRSHGPFSLGISGNDAVDNLLIIEQLAKMAAISKFLNPSIEDISKEALASKHYLRKHGKDAYYGQKRK